MDIDEVFKRTKGLLAPDELERHMAREERFQAFWRFQGTSLLRNLSITVASPLGEVYPVFCRHCGCPQGGVTREAMENGVILICRPCAEQHGGLPLPEVPDELIRPSRRN